jgi:hypothetical protein
MDYSCPCCGKSLEGKGDLMVAELRNDCKQVTCIYCTKTIQIKSNQYYQQATKLIFLLPTSLFIKLIFSDKAIAWEWWAGNAALAVVCYLGFRHMYLEQKTAKFYEEPRFNRPIPKQRKIGK